MSRIKRGVLCRDGVESLSERRARFGQTFPAIGRRHGVCRGRQRRLVDHRPGHRNHVIVLRPLHHVARSAIVRRPLVSGALSENVAQTQEDEDRQRQEDDGVNIHVVFAFWSAPATASGGRAFPHRNGGGYIMDGSAICRHETWPSQWRDLTRRAMTVEMGQAGALSPFATRELYAFSLRGETPMLTGNRAY